MAQAGPGGARWIAGDRQLAAACEGWRTRTRLALDTEFERVRTYYPRAGLVQVHDGEQAWLVDPLEIHDWRPFATVLEAPGLTKVVHACAEDCELLRLLTATLPDPLFDTQVAAAFAGLGTQRGYADLVEAVLDERVPREETRSDWLARPLSEAQVRYAVADVAWLPRLHDRLAERLAARPRQAHWAAEETRRIAASRAAEADPEASHLRIRGARDLDPGATAALHALAAWREREARARDRPRRRILSDEALLELARARPPGIAALRTLPGIPGRVTRRHGAALLGALASAAAAPSAAPRAGRRRAPAARIRSLARCARARAEALDLPPELLAPRRLLEAIAQRADELGTGAVDSVLEGWRREALGEALRSALEDQGDG